METNPITAEHKRVRELIDHKNPVDLSDPRLARITRLRLVSDPGFPFFDVSYCYGVLKDGTHVRVDLPAHQFPRRGLNRALVEMCQEAGVYGRGLGIFDGDVISICA
jgi:hypothetical protein